MVDAGTKLIVLAHGTIVAIVQGNNMWPLFFCAFWACSFWYRCTNSGLSNRVKWLFFGAYAIGAAVVYIQPDRGISKLWQLVAIPGIYYLVLVVLALLIAVGIWGYRRIWGKNSANPTPIGAGD